MLYILMHSPFMCDFRSLLRIIRGKDELLLISDGVVAGVMNSCINNDLVSLMVPIYALGSDVVIRGLSNCISEKIFLIDYIGFVKLTEKHSLSISW